jgi:hypothetical protein
MGSDGFIFLNDGLGKILWQPEAIGGSPNPYLAQPDAFAYGGSSWLSLTWNGNLELYADYIWNTLDAWQPYNGSSATYIAVGDDGLFSIYDDQWNELWGALHDPNYNFDERYYNACNVHGAC